MLQLVILLYQLTYGKSFSVCLESDQDELHESLQFALPTPVSPKKTKLDEAQFTSIVRALLELSGGRVDLRQHKYAEEYTASENANLYASLFNITRTRRFGDFEPEEMCKTLSKSPVFSEMAISVQDFERTDYKDEGLGQVENLNVYL